MLNMRHHSYPSPGLDHQAREYRSIADVRRANARCGQVFFDPETLRYFGCRVGRALYGGRYFVTSEQDPSGTAWEGQRRYTVRAAANDGRIYTVSEFGEFTTPAAARAFAQSLAGIGRAA